VLALEQRVAERPAELAGDRRSPHEAQLSRAQARETLAPDVVGQVPVARAPPRRERDEVEARRPSFAGLDQLGDLGLGEIGARRLHELLRVRLAQRELVDPDRWGRETADPEPERWPPRESNRRAVRERGKELSQQTARVAGSHG